MASILNEIGLFQFENLILNRIPFALLNLGVDTSARFSSYYQSHLDAQTINSTAATALGDMQSRSVPADQALVVLADDESAAAMVVDELEGQGYTNVFYVKGGIRRQPEPSL